MTGPVGATDRPTAEVLRRVFGDRAPLASAYAELLAGDGVQHGLIGPREVDRLWQRHILNSAALAELIAPGARVIDVGSGAGLPGIPVAVARPDLTVVLVEPMQRRVRFLDRAVSELDLAGVTVVRGRAEELVSDPRVARADFVTARAVAPLGRLALVSLPLLRPAGALLALKGSRVDQEVEESRAEVRRSGGGPPVVSRCGAAFLESPAVVVSIRRLAEVDRSRR